MADKCKYCGATLDTDGYCSRPCKKGESEKKIAEDRKAVEAEKAEALASA